MIFTNFSIDNLQYFDFTIFFLSKEWLAIKEAERQREDPVIRLERENKKLLSDNMRLDTENDNLARELVNR